MTAIKRSRHTARSIVRLLRLRGPLGRRTVATLAADVLARRSRVRSIEIAGYRAFIRSNTTDLDVAVDCLITGEYDSLRLASCRSIIDAGAHIGLATIVLARRFCDATIIAIEPEQENFDLLVRNTAHLPNVVAVRAAVWSDETARQLPDRMTGPWGYTIADSENRSEWTGQTVDCVTIESIMERFGFDRIDILKLDVEGSEKSILEHSNAWIDKVSALTIELHDRIVVGCSRAFYLATQGFERFEVNGEKVTAYRFPKGLASVPSSGSGESQQVHSGVRW